MKTFKMGSLIFVLSTLLVLLVSTNVLADTWQNEFLHNGTGQTANDLEKYINGNVLVSSWCSALFHSFSYIYLPGQNMTKLRWYNGNVANCQWTNACFRTDKRTITHRYLPRWSFNGIPGPIAGAALSVDFQVPAPGLINMTLANTPIDGGPVTIGIIQVGPTNTVYPIEALKWGNLNTTLWCDTRTNVPLCTTGSLLLPALPIPPTAVGIVYRARIWLDADPTNIVEYVGQFTTDTAPAP
jgi:hypothetical protein